MKTNILQQEAEKSLEKIQKGYDDIHKTILSTCKEARKISEEYFDASAPNSRLRLHERIDANEKLKNKIDNILKVQEVLNHQEAVITEILSNAKEDTIKQ